MHSQSGTWAVCEYWFLPCKLFASDETGTCYQVWPLSRPSEWDCSNEFQSNCQQQLTKQPGNAHFCLTVAGRFIGLCDLNQWFVCLFIYLFITPILHGKMSKYLTWKGILIKSTLADWIHPWNVNAISPFLSNLNWICITTPFFKWGKVAFKKACQFQQGCGHLNFCCAILLYTQVQASVPESFIVTFFRLFICCLIIWLSYIYIYIFAVDYSCCRLLLLVVLVQML